MRWAGAGGEAAQALARCANRAGKGPGGELCGTHAKQLEAKGALANGMVPRTIDIDGDADDDAGSDSSDGPGDDAHQSRGGGGKRRGASSAGASGASPQPSRASRSKRRPESPRAARRSSVSSLSVSPRGSDGQAHATPPSDRRSSTASSDSVSVEVSPEDVARMRSRNVQEDEDSARVVKRGGALLAALNEKTSPRSSSSSWRGRLCWWGVVLFLLNLIATVAIVGGPTEMYEVLEPSWQAELPWPPPGADRLRSRRVLVTGANRGYGRAIADHLCGLGAHVVLHCRSDRACANSTAAVLRACHSGGTARYVLADLADPASVVAMATRLADEGVRLDTVVANAAMVDPTAAPAIQADGHGSDRGDSEVRKMFAVNYLSNVVLMRELIARGVVAPGADDGTSLRPRVVLVSSGTYAHGSTEAFGAREGWSAVGAMGAYGQTKFLLHAWGAALEKAYPWLDVVVHSPGPIFTDLGREHVPFPLVPTYLLMKHALFPSAAVASKPAIALAVPKGDGDTDGVGYPSGAFVHIREDRTAALLPAVLAPETHTWLRGHTVAALADLGYGDGWLAEGVPGAGAGDGDGVGSAGSDAADDGVDAAGGDVGIADDGVAPTAGSSATESPTDATPGMGGERPIPAATGPTQSDAAADNTDTGANAAQDAMTTPTALVPQSPPSSLPEAAAAVSSAEEALAESSAVAEEAPLEQLDDGAAEGDGASMYAPPTPVVDVRIRAVDASLRSLVTKAWTLCVDTLGSTADIDGLGYYACHGAGGNQGFWFTPSDEIRVVAGDYDACLDAWGPMPAEVVRGPCHEEGGNQAWLVDESGAIRHGPESAHPNGCLEASAGPDGNIRLLVATCDSTNKEQKWDLPKIEARSEL